MDCPRAGRFVGGCKFRPRYDLGAPTFPGDSLSEISTSANAVYVLMKESKPQTYVADVCERCGKMTARPNAEEKG